VSDMHAKHLNVLKAAKKKGAKIRILTPNVDSKSAKALSAVAEVRKLGKPMGRVFNIDGEHFMVSLTDAKEVHHTQDVAFWAGSSHVGGVLNHLFDSLWNQ
jgi:hypothetical protein